MAAFKGALSKEQWLAERDRLALGKHHDYPGLTRVTVRRPLATIENRRAWDDATFGWLDDPLRPGGYDRLGMINLGSLRYEFWFTDPNVAFEFKMRWG